MRIKFLSFSLLLLFFQICLGAEIQGQVFLEDKKTKKPLKNIPVRLHVYKDDYEFSGAEIRTDSSGHYRFPNLDSNERFAYIVYPIYQGINYPYSEVYFEKSQTERKDFVLRETTGSASDISVNENIFFEQEPKDNWLITHEITFLNNGEFLYHPDRPDTEPLKFPLMPGGFNLSYLDGITRDNSDIDDQNDILSVFLTLSPHDPVTIKFSYHYIPDVGCLCDV